MRRLGKWLWSQADVIVAVEALYVMEKTDGWWSWVLGASVAGVALAIAKHQGERKGRIEAKSTEQPVASGDDLLELSERLERVRAFALGERNKLINDGMSEQLAEALHANLYVIGAQREMSK